MISLERTGIVLRPRSECEAKFNAGMIRADKTVHMLYRYCEKRKKWAGKSIDWKRAGNNFPYVKDCIRYASLNLDGTLENDSEKDVICPGNPDTIGCEDPRIVKFEGAYYIFYCSVERGFPHVAVAMTQDFSSYERLGTVPCGLPDKDAFIFPERINGKIYYVHRVEPNIHIDAFDSIDELMSRKAWKGYRPAAANTVMRPLYEFEGKKIGGGVPPIRVDGGWLLIYHAVDSSGIYRIGTCLLSEEDPRIIKARLPYPVLSPETPYEMSGDYCGCIFPQGYFINGSDIYISYGAADKYTAIAKTDVSRLVNELLRNKA